MRVAFDEQIFAIQRYGGISRVFAELAHEFISEPDLGVELQPVAAPLVNEYVLRDPRTAKSLAIHPSRHWSLSIARSLARRRHHGPVDIVHNTFYLPRALADYPQARRVVTVHDMIPELFPQTRRRLDFLTVKKKYVLSADHIVCVSESTKKDMLDIYGQVDAPISVVHSGVGAEFTPSAPPIPKWPDNYVLHVGHRGAYKGGTTLFRAFSRVREAFPETTLVLAGGGPLSKHELALANSLNIRDRILQQQVPDTLMPSAYANAQLFVFPSTYEGFGLPVVEAMASGTPMVLCRSSALPEIAGDAAEFFAPGDCEALAEAMSDVLASEDRLAALRAKGLARAAGFTWRQTSGMMADVYKMTMSEAK